MARTDAPSIIAPTRGDVAHAAWHLAFLLLAFLACMPMPLRCCGVGLCCARGQCDPAPRLQSRRVRRAATPAPFGAPCGPSLSGLPCAGAAAETRVIAGCWYRCRVPHRSPGTGTGTGTSVAQGSRIVGSTLSAHSAQRELRIRLRTAVQGTVIVQ